MRFKRGLSRGILVSGLAGGLGFAAIAQARGGNAEQPPAEAVAAAQRASDLMLNELFAALLQEFDETTPDNVPDGIRAISLVFDDANDNMRLVGNLQPLHQNDRPRDAFERAALEQALAGNPYTNVERDRGRWYYRRSVPLSNFRAECGLCHANFGPTNPNQLVGALMLRVPVED
jgi:hypothetical protein